PGWIEGVVSAGGSASTGGACTVVLDRHPEPRGASDEAPALATPDVQGRFLLRALQPGLYGVRATRSLAALTSPGVAWSLAGTVFRADGPAHEDVQVVAGRGTAVQLRGGAPADGPAGHVFGSAQIDARLAAGCVFVVRTESERRTAKVDDAGRFDCGQFAAGHLDCRLIDRSIMPGQTSGALWQQRFELRAGEERQVASDLHPTSLCGVALGPDGPAAGVRVQASSRPLDLSGDQQASWHAAETGSDGSFRFDRVPAGVYQLNAEATGGRTLRGSLGGVRADGSAPVTGLCLRMLPTAVVAGRVDLA